MGEILSGDKLDTKEIRKLGSVYVSCWFSVLSAEFPFYTFSDLVEEAAQQIESRISIFPEGQLAYKDSLDGIVAGVSALRVSAKGKTKRMPNYTKVPETWHALTGSGYFTTHKKQGNLLVCSAIYVPQEQSGKGIARQLLHAETALAQERGIIAVPYSRPIGFRTYLEKHGFDKNVDYTAIDARDLLAQLSTYLQKNATNETHFDKSIGMHSHFGARVVRLLPNARPADADSCGFCVLMAYPKNYVIPLR